MIRRDFMRRLAATAAGLLVADDVLETVAPARRFWPGADFGSPIRFRGPAAPSDPWVTWFHGGPLAGHSQRFDGGVPRDLRVAVGTGPVLPGRYELGPFPGGPDATRGTVGLVWRADA